MISASAAAEGEAPYNEAVMAGGDDAGSPALLPMQPEWAHWLPASATGFSTAAVHQHTDHTYSPDHTEQ